MARIGKLFIWTIGIIVGLLVIAVVGLTLFFPEDKVRDIATSKGSELLGRTVEIGVIDFSIWGGLGVELNNVAIGNPPGWQSPQMASVEKLDVKLQFWPLLSGNYKVSRLVVTAPKVYLEKHVDGTTNYVFANLDSAAVGTPAQAVPSEAKGATAAIAFDRLELVNGLISYVDDSSKLSARLNGITLESSLNTSSSGSYQSKGRLVVDTAVVTTDSPFPPMQVTLNYAGDYAPATKALVLKDTRLSINGVTLDLAANLVVDTPGTAGSISVNAADLSVSQLLSLLSPTQREILADYTVDGNFSLHADVTLKPEDSAGMYYEGNAELNGMKLAAKAIPGQMLVQRASLDFRTDTVRLTIAEGSFDGNPLLGHAIVENFADPNARGEIAGTLDLAYVMPFLPTAGKHEMSGKTKFNVSFAGPVKRFEQADFAGRVEMTNGTYFSPLVPESLQNIMLDIRFDKNVSTVSTFTAQSKSADINFTGRMEGLLAYFLADSAHAQSIRTLVDGKLKVNGDLALANAYLPPKGNPKLMGKANLDIAVTGPINDMAAIKPRGSIQITNASYTDSLLPEPVRQLEADIFVNPDTIMVRKLDVQFVSSDVSLIGKLSKPFPYLLPLQTLDRSKLAKPVFLFSLKSKKFDTDKLFPEAVPGAQDSAVAAAAAASGAEAMDSVSMLLLPDIDGRGAISFDTLVYSKVEFTNVTGQVKIHDRKIDVNDVQGKVYSGSVTGQTTLDLNDFSAPRYSGEFQASQVEADDFVQRFTPFSGFLFGKLELKGTYDAVGWEPEDFLKSLSMNGQSAVKEGKLVMSGFAHTAVSSFASLFGGSIAAEQPVRNFLSNIVVEDGRVKVDKLKTSLGTLGDLELGGSYGFNGGLGYSGSILLSKEMSSKLLNSKLFGSVAGSLTDDSNQRLPLPLSIEGTVDKPVLKLDTEGMVKQATTSLLKNAGKGLLQKAEDFLKKK